MGTLSRFKVQPGRGKVRPTCQHCGAGRRELRGKQGELGNYWLCASCGKSTMMLMQCSNCDALGLDGLVKITLHHGGFWRDCVACDHSDRL